MKKIKDRKFIKKSNELMCKLKNIGFKESAQVEFKKSTSELKEKTIDISVILNKHNKAQMFFGIKKY